ncbi:MAG: hypothetical protein AVDCRST_MAG93-829, partial [uncultured Chloroflexia bacterium]
EDEHLRRRAACANSAQGRHRRRDHCCHLPYLWHVARRQEECKSVL